MRYQGALGLRNFQMLRPSFLSGYGTTQPAGEESLLFDVNDTIGIGSIILSIPTSILAWSSLRQRREQKEATRKAEQDRMLAAKEAAAAKTRQEEIQIAVNQALTKMKVAADTQIVAAAAQANAATSLGEIHHMVNDEKDALKENVDRLNREVEKLRAQINNGHHT